MSVTERIRLEAFGRVKRGELAELAGLSMRQARRACLGSLVQMDGSRHDWFQGRSGMRETRGGRNKTKRGDISTFACAVTILPFYNIVDRRDPDARRPRRLSTPVLSRG